MISGTALTIIGGVATLGGVACNLANDWAHKKQEEAMIREMVSEEVNKILSEKEEEEA